MRIDTSWMQGAINGYYDSISRMQSRNAALSAQIDRLYRAKSAVEGIYRDDRSWVSWLGSYDVGGAWQGGRREEFEAAKRSAKSCGDEYCNGVAEVHRAICAKITQLENERADGFGAISWAYRCINNVQGQLDWALRQMRND